MSSSRRFSRSVCLSRVATSYAPRTYTVACRSFATAKKKDDLVFVVPSDWDLEYLSKFEVKATPEQLAKVIPAPHVDLPGKLGELTADLFEVASVFDSIETVGQELQAFAKYAAQQPELVEFIEDKSQSKKQTRALFEQLFKTSSPVLKRFIARMIENNDFYRLLKVAEGYSEMLKVYKKEFSAVLLVAKMPSPEKLERLKARLSFLHMPKGSRPVWEIREKPELIEGFTLTTPDALVDNSELKRRKEVQDRLATIWAKIEASQPKPPADGVLHQLARFNVKQHTQELAKALQTAAAETKKIEEEQYRAHFVDWV